MSASEIGASEETKVPAEVLRLLKGLKDPTPLCPELAACLGEVGLGGFRMPALRHPLVYAVPYLAVQNEMLNEALVAKKAAIDKAIKSRSLSRYVVLHERPYRGEAIQSWVERHALCEAVIREACPDDDKAVEKALRKAAKDYWETVAWAWRDSENISEDPQMWMEFWTNPPVGYEAYKHFAMSADDRKTLAGLPELITIYHGQESAAADGSDGIGCSWTTDLGVANWFAQRFCEGEPRPVFAAQVRKEDVVAYLGGRGESEVIINPDRLLGLREIELVERVADRAQTTRD